MGGSQALAGLAVEIFVEHQQVAPLRVGLMRTVHGKGGNQVGFIAAENVCEPLSQYRGGVFEVNFLAVQAGCRKSKGITQVAM